MNTRKIVGVNFYNDRQNFELGVKDYYYFTTENHEVGDYLVVKVNDIPKVVRVSQATKTIEYDHARNHATKWIYATTDPIGQERIDAAIAKDEIWAQITRRVTEIKQAKHIEELASEDKILRKLWRKFNS